MVTQLALPMAVLVTLALLAKPSLGQACEGRWLVGQEHPGITGGTVYAATMWDPDGSGPAGHSRLWWID
jgi:hypothetical protein